MCCFNVPKLVKARLSDVKKFGFDRFHGYKVMDVYPWEYLNKSSNLRIPCIQYNEICKNMGVNPGSMLAPRALIRTPVMNVPLDLTSNVLAASDWEGDPTPFSNVEYPLRSNDSVGPGLHVYKDFDVAFEDYGYFRKKSDPFGSKATARLFIPVVGMMEDYMAEDEHTIVFKKVFIEDHIWKQLLDYFLPEWEIT